jgi:probable F420-dependent oxidoreductase
MPSTATSELRRAVGRVGVWLFGRAMEADAPAIGRRIEGLGYPTLWVGGGNTNPAALARLDDVLRGSERLIVATGITSIWAWEPAELARRAGELAAGNGRFVLGLGVSHQPLVEHLGRRYERPYSAMAAYLDELDAAGGDVPVVLAALGDKMLTLSRDRSAGAHPYFTPVEHTARARRVLGAEPLLAPELAVVLDEDPVTARATARAYAERYLALPNYAQNLLRLGYSADDLAGGGSDRLVDAVIAWGSAAAIAERVRAHLDAGADHVCIQPLAPDGEMDFDALGELAPLLLGAGR